MIRKIRLGIDVGGTFTKAVAIDILTGELLGKMTVPTTHNADNGVAEGIVLALKNLMETYSIQKSEIELISHSTTQAVNALLEGDTAKVGIIGMGVALEKSNVVKRTNIKNIELAIFFNNLQHENTYISVVGLIKEIVYFRTKDSNSLCGYNKPDIDEPYQQALEIVKSMEAECKRVD